MNTFALSTSTAFANCVADLARNDKGFCVSDSNLVREDGSVESPLSYSWPSKTKSFDLRLRSCVNFGSDRNKLDDLLIAIDRGATLKTSDLSANGKSVSLAVARELLTKLESEPQSQFMKIGLVMFGSEKNCKAYQPGNIPSGANFPCRYLPLGPVGAQKALIRSFLDEAEGKYSALEDEHGSNFSILTDVIKDGSLGVEQTTTTLLFSDMRFYKADHDDEFGYLRTSNYRAAQKDILENLSQEVAGSTRLNVALVGESYNAFDAQFKSSYSNYCALEPDSSDCGSRVDENSPETWPVNNLDLNAFAQSLSRKISGPRGQIVSVDRLSAKSSATTLLNSARGGRESLISGELTLKNGNIIVGALEGDVLTFPNISANQIGNLEVSLKSSSQEQILPIAVTLDDETASFNSELQCRGVSSKKSSDFVGGCGVVSASSQNFKQVMFFLLLPILMLFGRKWLFIFVFILSAFMMLSDPGVAREIDGYNIHAYDVPTAEGVGFAENGYTLSPLNVTAALFFDYASGLVRVSEMEDEEDAKIVDQSFTTTAALGLGVTRWLSLGVQVPYIQNRAIHRQVFDEEGREHDVLATEESSLGDTTVWMKFWLLSLGKFNTSIMPIYKIDTGKKENLTGDGQASYGGKILISQAFGRLAFALNLGYLQRQEEVRLSDNRVGKPLILKSQYLLNFGMSYKVSQNLSSELSYQGKFAQEAGFKNDPRNPNEAGVSMRFRVSQNMHVFTGASTGVGQGIGAPEYRVNTGLYYLPALVSAPQVKPTSQIVKTSRPHVMQKTSEKSLPPKKTLIKMRK